MEATERPCVGVPTEGDITEAVRAVRGCYESGKTRSVRWREQQLDGLVTMLEREEDRLLDALVADAGKARFGAWLTDLAALKPEIEALRKHVARWAAPRRVRVPLRSQPSKGYIQPEPMGVALVIAPWNFPIYLLLFPAAAALAAGNAVVLKPSEMMPRTAELLAELLPRYLDPAACAVVTGGVEISTALLEERFDHIFFTGSTTVGRVVSEAAARHLTPVTLELGGKSPVLVDDSANLAIAGRRIAWGKWVNAGQACVAPDYVLVSEARRDQLVAEMVKAFISFTQGDVHTSAHFDRIANDQQVERLGRLLGDHGGMVVFGGGIDRVARIIEPTVVIDPDDGSALMSEEIFGPVVVVRTVASMDEAIRFVNARPKPLALYVFAEDRAAVTRIVESTTSGGVCVNQVLLHLDPPALPFGGVGASGTGRYHGQASFDTFSNLKSVLHKRSRPDPALLYPPFPERRKRLIRRLIW